jgi:hypothetical protein
MHAKQTFDFSLTVHYVTTTGVVTCRTSTGRKHGSEQAMRRFLTTQEATMKASIAHAKRFLITTGTYQVL